MIGVLSQKNEMEIIREFFQLLKTPWEFCSKNRSYDVLISTGKTSHNVTSSLQIVFSSEKSLVDSLLGISIGSQLQNVSLNYYDFEIPIYGKLLTFKGPGKPILQISRIGEIGGLEISRSKYNLIRIGYDLFKEVEYLLSTGQPINNAHIPTLEIHISMLRNLIVRSGIPLLEIPPVPAAYDFITCLTHDVDFAGIRKHKIDHTMCGFLYRGVVGSFFNLLRRRLPLRRLISNWKAVFSLPFVYLGLCKDFWLQFDRFLEIEKDLKSTFFFVPFKNRAGEKVCSNYHKRRATKYDITDVQEVVKKLTRLGFEIGVHGIDAWHDPAKAREEFMRISEITGKTEIGVRMHWLYFDNRSPRIFEIAGFHFDSTFGYNETIGYRGGTTQLFRPIGVTNLLELPLHIHDMALFRPHFGFQSFWLSEAQAWKLCEKTINEVSRYGGVLTILWHMRSLAPERLWGDFYINLLQELKSRSAWFATANQVVQWFNKRRAVIFRDVHSSGNSLRINFEYEGNPPIPNLILRVHKPHSKSNALFGTEPSYVDTVWRGEKEIELFFD